MTAILAQDGESEARTAGGDEGAGRTRPAHVRWMPHLGAEAVALYELLRVLPDVGREEVDVEELAELLRSTPESVEASFRTLAGAGFLLEREGWLEVSEHPPRALERLRRTKT